MVIVYKPFWPNPLFVKMSLEQHLVRKLLWPQTNPSSVNLSFPSQFVSWSILILKTASWQNSRTGDHLIFVFVYKLGLVLSANKLLRNREYLNWWWFHHLDCSRNGGIYKDIICCWNQTLQHAAKEPQYTSSEMLKNNLNKKRRNL